MPNMQQYFMGNTAFPYAQPHPYYTATPNAATFTPPPHPTTYSSGSMTASANTMQFYPNWPSAANTFAQYQQTAQNASGSKMPPLAAMTGYYPNGAPMTQAEMAAWQQNPFSSRNASAAAAAAASNQWLYGQGYQYNPYNV
jgi:hypothetical protein